MKKCFIAVFILWISCSKDTPTNVEASREQTYTLLVNNGEGGSVNTTGGTYNQGQIVSITATPNSGYQFIGWSGDVSTSTNPLSITIESNTTITAIFEAIPFDKYTSIFEDINDQQLYIDTWIQDAIDYGRGDLIDALDNLVLEPINSDRYSDGGYALICSEDDTIWLHSDFFENSTYQFGALSSPDLYRIYLVYHEIGHTILELNHANYAGEDNNSSVITATAGYLPDQYDIMGYPTQNGDGFFRFNPEEWDDMLQRYFNPDQEWIANCENGEVGVGLGVGKWKIKKNSLETIHSINISEDTTSKNSNATFNIVVNDLNLSLSETTYFDCRESGDGIYYYFDGNIDGDIQVVLLISAVDGGENNDGGFISIDFYYPDDTTKNAMIGFRSRVEESVEFVEIVNNQWTVNFDGTAYRTYYNEQGNYVYTDDEIRTIVSANGNCN